ncbi:organic solvent tolerance protein [Legionella spiritensis]|uniref:LPS-assembly protein LptD n=2 Tax=Legionella spiritensis TaxID=452 RepID=A0A0W0Z851_LEGSP|nr:organic solvent tolerance protein [Legionella spiritensis]SNV30011.1 organic solvent tolerance protein [Legionella spiritensis]
MRLKGVILRLNSVIKRQWLPAIGIVAVCFSTMLYHQSLRAGATVIEPVQACVIPRNIDLDDDRRAKIAQCLGWQPNPDQSLCLGTYQPLDVAPLSDEDEVNILADDVSLYQQGRSRLAGNVEVRQTGRVVNAQTAYVYRDAQSNKVTKIELLGEVTYLEPGRLMIARKASINPQDRSGHVEDVLYRFTSLKPGAVLPAWGRASLIERFANKDYLLQQATYTTCAPQDRAWHIEAKSIKLDQASATGVARDAKLLIGNVPVFYTPYLSFPTSRERKSGFLMPVVGSSNVGGVDFSLPYYWNIAPNYDATLIPHVYTRRGLMMGGQFRFLTEQSAGVISGNFLPDDRAYQKFLNDNSLEFPQLQGNSNNRWSFQVQNATQFYPGLRMNINVQQVSDDYYLQDFSTNLALLTERQLLRQGDISYTTDHWLFRSMVQSYQTLQPVNLSPISDIYERLPQLLAIGSYDDLPFNGNLTLHGQFDYFNWPNHVLLQPQGPRYYFNPVLSLPQNKPWGYITPSVELVQNYYDVRSAGRNIAGTTMLTGSYYNALDMGSIANEHFSRTIPRVSLDSGLFFERYTRFLNHGLIQTLEPRLYYLYVPFKNQTNIPVYDSAYMIFNTDQLFRTNRFSGYDRIGDANQLAYAVTTRWISEESGVEKASLAVGQIRYFADRNVLLCQSASGYCVENPDTLGFLSPLAKSSPIASRAVYRFNSAWSVIGDYIWDPYTHSTNNAHLNFHYQPEINHIISLGYNYLVNGDITQVASSNNIQDNSLNQITLAYAWPFNEQWSSLGAYSYNVSKQYEMMSFLGLQYDSCCWAVRLMGGRTFRSLNNQLRPQYNNNVYLQFLLKGLGSVGNNDPASRIQTYIPGYLDGFHH